MLTAYQPKVQQKLAHARLLLECCAKCGDQLPERQKREAFLSAAIMQLGVAYGLYLKELASQHQLPAVSRLHTLEQLSHDLNQRGIEDLAVSELERLAQDGWLFDLLSLHQQAQYPVISDAHDAVVPAGSTVDASLIASSNAHAPDISEGRVSGFLDELMHLIERQRHSNLEY